MDTLDRKLTFRATAMSRERFELECKVGIVRAPDRSRFRIASLASWFHGRDSSSLGPKQDAYGIVMTGSPDREKVQRVTREELHALVWQKPMIHLAEQFGISGNGLAKISDRLNVPYPPRGYWAKREAGKPVFFGQASTPHKWDPADG